MRTVAGFLILASTFLSPFLSSPAFALEPQDPQTLCDRFISEPEQKLCEKKVKLISPDWYLASACGHQFDDSSFYSCLEMGRKTGFAPLALEKCSSEDLSDEARLQCVKSAQTDLKKSFQSRQAASRGKTTRKAVKAPAELPKANRDL